jgi:hypothetical protein
MKKIIFILLLSSSCFCQSNFIRIYTTDNLVINCKKIIEQKDYTSCENFEGKFSYLENSKIIYISNIDTTIERFEYKNKVLDDVKVFNVNNVDSKELFRRSKNWVIENFKNPNEVIKGTIENEMIRFNGVRLNAVSIITFGSTFTYSLNYTITLYFKDGKYKLEITNIHYRVPPSQYNLDGIDVPLKDGTGFYNKKGELRNGVRKVPYQVEDIVNELSLSLYNYIINNDKKKNEW